MDALLEAEGLDGWLVADYAGSNPVFAHLLDAHVHLTRRTFLLVTREQRRMLVSQVDATEEIAELAGDFALDTYRGWPELRAWLKTHVGPLSTVAMEYSPHGELPAMSRVDGGTLDLVRELGVEVRPSANLFQQAAGAWTDANLRSHRAAMVHAADIKDLAFAHAGERLRAGEPCGERDVQVFILEQFERRGLVTADPPVVAANANSGDPHYAPNAERSAELRRGDWLMIDLWCKERADHAVFADITWVGLLGGDVPDEHAKVFDAVARGRDAVIETLRERSNGAGPVRGFELDRVARRTIDEAGFGEHFVHRTGHSLSPGDLVHGLAANLDDLETHDTRPILPGFGFTVEPGVYLPSFGVRLEINVFMTEQGPDITSPVQTAPVLVDAG